MSTTKKPLAKKRQKTPLEFTIKDKPEFKALIDAMRKVLGGNVKFTNASVKALYDHLSNIMPTLAEEESIKNFWSTLCEQLDFDGLVTTEIVALLPLGGFAGYDNIGENCGTLVIHNYNDEITKEQFAAFMILLMWMFGCDMVEKNLAGMLAFSHQMNHASNCFDLVDHIIENTPNFPKVYSYSTTNFRNSNTGNHLYYTQIIIDTNPDEEEEEVNPEGAEVAPA